MLTEEDVGVILLAWLLLFPFGGERLLLGAVLGLGGLPPDTTARLTGAFLITRTFCWLALNSEASIAELLLNCEVCLGAGC